MFLQNVKCLCYGTLRYVTLRESEKQALALNNAAFHSTRELVITRNHEFTSSEIVFH